MAEGSIEVPAAAAARLRNLYESSRQIEQMAQMVTAMLVDALQVPQGWAMIENEQGILMFTSVTPVDTDLQPEE